MSNFFDGHTLPYLFGVSKISFSFKELTLYLARMHEIGPKKNCVTVYNIDSNNKCF